MEFGKACRCYFEYWEHFGNFETCVKSWNCFFRQIIQGQEFSSWFDRLIELLPTEFWRVLLRLIWPRHSVLLPIFSNLEWQSRGEVKSGPDLCSHLPNRASCAPWDRLFRTWSQYRIVHVGHRIYISPFLWTV